MAGTLFRVAVFSLLVFGVASLDVHHPNTHAKKRGAGAMLLQKMESFVQSKGQIGLSPAEKAEVMEIRQILNMDILPSLLQAVQEAQSQIDSLYQAVLDCQVQVVTGLQISTEMWDDVQIKQKNVTECWMEEVLIIDEELKICKDYEQIRTVLELPAIPPPDHTDNALAYNYLKTMSEYFCGIEKEYTDKWTECKMKKQNHTELIPICKQASEDYEVSICGWDAELQETCTEYMGCWNESVTRYNERVAALSSLEEDQKAELEAVKKLDCLWEAWNYSTDPCIVNITMVKVCEEIPINFTNVTLIVPDLPEPRSCPPPPKEGQQDPALPCSDEFMNSAFGYLGLPSDELAMLKADCRECPH